MSNESIQPRIRNNICLNVDPDGCRRQVKQMVAREKNQKPVNDGPKRVLVLGCSSGYGLASRITASFGSGASTIGVSFEKAPFSKRTGTPGWYNNRTFEEEAEKSGILAKTFEGDAFSTEMKDLVVDYIKENLGTVDMVVYSLASGIRVDPVTGETYRSVLKPIGDVYTGMSMDIQNGTLNSRSIEPAEKEEIESTVKVMGGEDWQLWINRLQNEGLLEEGVLTIAYSYIGPDMTFPLYRQGTIGQAKKHMELTTDAIRSDLQKINGDARVSINKAMVTRASSVIPVLSLYMAVLFKVMKEKGIHEGCEEQISRLFRERLDGHLLSAGGDGKYEVDSKGRLRIDDLELQDDVQTEVKVRVKEILRTFEVDNTDWKGLRQDFLQIHGFEVPQEV